MASLSQTILQQTMQGQQASEAQGLETIRGIGKFIQDTQKQKALLEQKKAAVQDSQLNYANNSFEQLSKIKDSRLRDAMIKNNIIPQWKSRGIDKLIPLDNVKVFASNDDNRARMRALVEMRKNNEISTEEYMQMTSDVAAFSEVTPFFEQDTRRELKEIEKAEAGQLDATTKLRNEYDRDPIIKAGKMSLDGLRKVEASAKEDSATGDVGLIFGFMKTLDPESVVREGEFATAEQAAGVPDRIINLYNKLLTGERLTPGQRENFLSTARANTQATLSQVRATNQRYRQLAGAYNVRPEFVISSTFDQEMPGMEEVREETQAAPKQSAETKQKQRSIRQLTGESAEIKNIVSKGISAITREENPAGIGELEAIFKQQGMTPEVLEQVMKQIKAGVSK